MKRSISQVSNRSLKSSVFLHPMTTKCLHSHDKVCANVIQLKKNKKVIIFFSMVFNFKKSRFLYFKRKLAINITFYNIFNHNRV